MAGAWLRFLGVRLAGTVLVLLVLSFGIYCLLYVAPGSVEQTLLGNRPATETTRAAVRTQYHLDDPLLLQYGRWLADAVQGNLGAVARFDSERHPQMRGKLVQVERLDGDQNPGATA